MDTFELGLPNLKKITIYKNFILYVIYSTILLGFIANTFGLSSVFYFIIDVFVVLLFVNSRRNLIQKIKDYHFQIYFALGIILIICQLLYVVFTQGIIGNALYGTYRFYRTFFFFYACLGYINESDVEKSVRLAKDIFWIHTAITIFQFLVLGLRQDLLNGVFGITMGGNGYVSTFLIGISIFLISAYFCKKINTRYFYIGQCIILLISALAEIKFIFIEIIVVLILTFLMSRSNYKKLLKLLGAVVVVISLYLILIYFFPEFKELVTRLRRGGFTTLVDLQRHYSTDLDFGRATFIQRAKSDFFTASYQTYFGLGIGQASSSSFVDNTFFVNNEWTHFDQFLSSYIYTEQGYVGFVYFLLFWGITIVNGIRYWINNRNNFWAITLISLGVMGVFITYYNAALYSQYGFIYYWFLAIAYYMARKGSVIGINSGGSKK